MQSNKCGAMRRRAWEIDNLLRNECGAALLSELRKSLGEDTEASDRAVDALWALASFDLACTAPRWDVRLTMEDLPAARLAWRDLLDQHMWLGEASAIDAARRAVEAAGSEHARVGGGLAAGR